jgi:hypothetical protein
MGDSDDELGGMEDEEDHWGKKSHDRDSRGDDRRREEEDGDRYSDIDEKFERKLKNNEYRPDDDIFEELIGGTKSKLELDRF